MVEECEVKTCKRKAVKDYEMTNYCWFHYLSISSKNEIEKKRQTQLNYAKAGGTLENDNTNR